MKVEETSFLNEYIAMADYGDRLGWHERNGGNFTYWMKPENVADVKDELHDKGEWLPIGTNVDNLANEYFLISGTGKYFHNMKKDPRHTIGIIQVDSTGTKYRIRWGLENGGRPTSEPVSYTHLNFLRSLLQKINLCILTYFLYDIW